MNSCIRESLRPGPVFIAKFEWSQEGNQFNLDRFPMEKLKQTLQAIHPLNSTIRKIFIEKNSIVGISDINNAGSIKSYLIIHSNGNLELAGAVPTGEWGEYKNAWWSGAFEIPLLSQINDSIKILINFLAVSEEISLRMELVQLENTAFIDGNGGSSEYPHPFPGGMKSFQYPVILSGCNNGYNWSQIELIDCFNALRKNFHASCMSPFYLKPYLN